MAPRRRRKPQTEGEPQRTAHSNTVHDEKEESLPSKNALMKKTKAALVDEVLALKEHLHHVTTEFSSEVKKVEKYKRSWLFCCWKRAVEEDNDDENFEERVHGSLLKTKMCRWGIFFALLAALISLIVSSTHYNADMTDGNLWDRISMQPPVEVPPEVQAAVTKIAKHFTEDSRATGRTMFELGLRKHYPVALLPGIVSTGLEMWEAEECYTPHTFRQRLWGSAQMFQKLVTNTKCWLQHMQLDEVSGLDPDGIKLRPATGLAAADYLFGNFWVWAKVIENLAALGYDSVNMELAAYDWRLAYADLERRDRFFTRLKRQLEGMRMMNDRKVVLLCHSMGGNVVTYFFNWVTQNDPKWVHNNIQTVSYIGVPLLGLPKTISSLLSGEMRDTAELGDFLDSIRQQLISQYDVARVMRTFRSIPGMIPKGGRRVWGDPSDPEKGCLVQFASQTCHHEGETGSACSESQHADEQQQKRCLHTEGVMDLFREVYPEYMKRIDEIYTFGVAQTAAEVKRNAQQSKTWSNPLQTALPNAPDMRVYCMYGTGLKTERGYWYRANDGVDGEEVPYVLDKDVMVGDKVVRGVVLDDGDATVPLRSLGFMCAKGWREYPRFNPSKVVTVAREYEDRDSGFVDKVLRTSNAVDHVDIMGNVDLITDLLRLVGRVHSDDRTSNFTVICPEGDCEAIFHEAENIYTFQLAQRSEKIDKFVAAIDLDQ